MRYNLFYKTFLLLLLAALVPPAAKAQLTFYHAWAGFNIPGGSPYLETYLTLVGKTLKSKKINGRFQQSVNISFTLYKDTQMVKANKYNLNGPLFDDSLKAPSFIDNQRYSLPNGNYRALIKVTDNNLSYKAPYLVEESIEINFNSTDLQSSSIQILESYKKAESIGPLTKSGFNLVPYTVNYFPETSNELCFYFETYNADKALGPGSSFIYTYYLENAENAMVMTNYGAFKKQIAATVNPLLAKMDISKLGTGNYNLVIAIKDKNNELKHLKKYFFQRLNRQVDIASLQQLSEIASVNEYFGNCNNADTLKMFVECLWPIADGADKERIINQVIAKKPDLLKKFAIDFWKRRAADTANPVKMWAAYYQQVQTAMALFKCGKMPGYFTDRGRVFLQYGPPNQRAQQVNEPNTYPYEIWQYYRITDAVNSQFFSNRKFVFVSRNLGDDCYSLIHSDMRGEINNPRWRFDVTRGNTNGLANPDNEMPGGVQNNQFNEIYSNPR